MKDSWELDQSSTIGSPLKYVLRVVDMEIYPHECLNDLQKKQYMTELGLEPILAWYNKEILKHQGNCKLKTQLVIKRNRTFQLLREEVRELFPEDLIHG